MLRARSAKPAERAQRPELGQKEEEEGEEERRDSLSLLFSRREERVQIHNTRRGSCGRKRNERGGRRRRGRRVTGLSLHLLKQYNNSFLSHPLSKGFYCDGQPPSLGIVSPLAKLLSNRHDYLSLSLSLCVSLSSSLQGRTNIVSGPPPPPSSKNPSRNTNLFFSPRIFTINRISELELENFFLLFLSFFFLRDKLRFEDLSHVFGK